MGTAISDIRIDLQFVKDLNRKHEEIVKRLASDKDVHRFKVYAHCLYEVLGEEGWQDMQIEFGDYSDFIVAYLEGRGPEREGEIAVSTMNAKKYSVGVGDTLKLRITGEEKVYSVCGIYQDVTNGGFTAKTVYPYEPEDVVKYTYFIDTEDGIFPDAKASELAKELSFAKVIPMEEYLAQTFDMVIDPLSQAAIAVKVVAVFITLLITVLFLKLNTAREYSRIANMKAMGFSVWDIRMQYMLKTGIAAVMGILAGILISNTLGESMVSALISAAGFGLSMIDFAIRPMEIYLLYPSMVIIAAVSAAWLCSAAVKKYNIVGMIQE
jgi:putative ABC transport system permease protein